MIIFTIISVLTGLICANWIKIIAPKTHPIMLVLIIINGPIVLCCLIGILFAPSTGARKNGVLVRA